MFKRSLIAALGALALVTLATTATFAAEPEDVEVDPGLTDQHPAGYYLWRDPEAGLHLRTHGPGEEHHFVATLRTDGVFYDVDPVRVESRDHYAVLDDGHTLVLRFRTFNWTDGLNFRIHGGSGVRLNLQLDGRPVGVEQIYLGALGKHPESNPFTLWRPCHEQHADQPLAS